MSHTCRRRLINISVRFIIKRFVSLDCIVCNLHDPLEQANFANSMILTIEIQIIPLTDGTHRQSNFEPYL